MTLRLLIAPALALTLALAACGGGDSDSTSTPTGSAAGVPGSPSPTGAAATTCTAGNIYAAVTGSQGAAGTLFLTVGVGNTIDACTLSGPPAINWYDESGTLLDVQPASVTTCGQGASDFTTCVFNGPVDLPSGAPTPAAGVNGPALAVIGVTNSSVLEPCGSTATAHFVGLEFPGVTPDAQAELSEDVDLQSCSRQVTLQGWGPVAGG